MCEEVEGLKDHADVCTELRQGLAFAGKQLTVDRDGARLEGLETVDRAAEGGLARARWADDHHDLAFANCQVDVFEDV